MTEISSRMDIGVMMDIKAVNELDVTEILYMLVGYTLDYSDNLKWINMIINSSSSHSRCSFIVVTQAIPIVTYA